MILYSWKLEINWRRERSLKGRGRRRPRVLLLMIENLLPRMGLKLSWDPAICLRPLTVSYSSHFLRCWSLSSLSLRLYSHLAPSSTFFLGGLNYWWASNVSVTIFFLGTFLFLNFLSRLMLNFTFITFALSLWSVINLLLFSFVVFPPRFNGQQFLTLHILPLQTPIPSVSFKTDAYLHSLMFASCFGTNIFVCFVFDGRPVLSLWQRRSLGTWLRLVSTLIVDSVALEFVARKSTLIRDTRQVWHLGSHGLPSTGIQSTGDIRFIQSGACFNFLTFTASSCLRTNLSFKGFIPEQFFPIWCSWTRTHSYLFFKTNTDFQASYLYNRPIPL